MTAPTAPVPDDRPDFPNSPDQDLNGVQLPEVAVGTPNPYSGARRFLVFASGANPHILAASPSEQNVYMGMGATVCSTATMAALSMTVAMSIAFDLPFVLAVPIGLFWGMLIFNLDRWFIVSQSNEAEGIARWGSFVGRLFLAVAFGYIIAEPLILKVFDDEIQAEVQVIVAERNEAARTAFNTGDDATRLAELEQQIQANIDEEERLRIAAANVESEIPRPDPTNYVSAERQEILDEITRITTERDLLQDEVDAAFAVYKEAEQARINEELFGAVEQDRPAGCGPVCRELKAAEQIALANYESIEATNRPLIDGYNASIQGYEQALTEVDSDGGLAAAQTTWDDTIADQRTSYTDAANDLAADRDGRLIPDRDALEDTIALQTANVEAEDGTGLLIQLEALERVAADNGRALFFRWALTVLLILVEALPVLGKFLYSLSGSHPYDTITQAVDRRATLTARTLEVQSSRDLFLMRQGLADRSRLAAHAEASVQRHAIERSVGIHRAMIDRILDDWAEENGVDRNTPPVVLDDLPPSAIPDFNEEYVEPPIHDARPVQPRTSDRRGDSAGESSPHPAPPSDPPHVDTEQIADEHAGREEQVAHRSPWAQRNSAEQANSKTTPPSTDARTESRPASAGDDAGFIIDLNAAAEVDATGGDEELEDDESTEVYAPNGGEGRL